MTFARIFGKEVNGGPQDVRFPSLGDPIAGTLAALPGGLGEAGSIGYSPWSSPQIDTNCRGIVGACRLSGRFAGRARQAVYRTPGIRLAAGEAARRAWPDRAPGHDHQWRRH